MQLFCVWRENSTQAKAHKQHSPQAKAQRQPTPQAEALREGSPQAEALPSCSGSSLRWWSLSCEQATRLVAMLGETSISIQPWLSLCLPAGLIWVSWCFVYCFLCCHFIPYSLIMSCFLWSQSKKIDLSITNKGSLRTYWPKLPRCTVEGMLWCWKSGIPTCLGCMVAQQFVPAEETFRISDGSTCSCSCKTKMEERCLRENVLLYNNAVVR